MKTSQHRTTTDAAIAAVKGLQKYFPLDQATNMACNRLINRIQSIKPGYNFWYKERIKTSQTIIVVVEGSNKKYSAEAEVVLWDYRYRTSVL